MSTLSFDLISVSTLTWITKKELEREIKIKGDKISLEEKQKRFIAAVRKRGKASCHQGEIKNERQRKKSEQEHIQHFLHKTCNWEVSGSFPLYSFKTTANKCTKKAGKVVFCQRLVFICRKNPRRSGLLLFANRSRFVHPKWSGIPKISSFH